MITQLGQLNTNALVVADVYVQIVPPQFYLNGVPSNLGGYVGTATWGPVDTPVLVGSPQEYTAKLGTYVARSYDMGTHVMIGFELGASAMWCIRVTDGTDVAAAATVQTNCLTLTSKYTGSYGNNCKVTIGAGGKANSKSVRVQMPGLVPEIFDNILQGVKSVAIGTGGSGVTAASIAFSDPPAGPTARTATGTVTVSGGAITAVVITDPGNGYATAPTATLTANGTGATLGTVTITYWPTIAEALNSGIPTQRSASDMVTAAAGAGTSAPTSASYQLAGGTDGAVGVNATRMIGVDTLPRTGMYALRSMPGGGISALDLCDVTDTTTWGTQDTFAQAEGCYAIVVGAAGESITTAAANKASAGIDSAWTKVLLGDWCYWNDTFTGNSKRLVSPQAFAAGKLQGMSPQHSLLNKRLANVVSTQKQLTGLAYTYADLQVLAQSGIDVIANPCPGGKYYGFRNGRNSSSNPSIHGDNYTRMTNFIAATLNAGMGIYVGQLQSRQPDDPTRRQAKATLDAFLANLKNPSALGQQGMIDDFYTVLDKSNNPDTRISIGYMQADVKVVYLSVVEFFIINLEGGQTVTIQRVPTNLAALAAAA